MIVSLTIIRYKKIFIPFALLAMASHRLPLWLNKEISVYKLMGSGKKARLVEMGGNNGSMFKVNRSKLEA